MSTPLVLLHGWGLSARVWTPVMQALPTHMTVVTPDLPGHGAAPAAPRGSLAAWSDTVLASLPPTMTLCGWSLGGLIALDLARRYPQRVTTLVLIDTSARFVAAPQEDPPWLHGLESGVVDGFIKGYAADPLPTLRRFVALQALGDARRRGVSAGLNDALTSAPSAGLADGLRILAESDLRATLGEIQQPVHVIHGARDALMPVAGAAWLAGHLPHATLNILGDCGHAPLLSRPLDCTTLMAEWA
ncbi:MAG: alpha/beta fold hydrolase [Rhodocyclales bacterium]|nr:alpha/beta fold hydrolase [Rhodocyclales bacterium]